MTGITKEFDKVQIMYADLKTLYNREKFEVRDIDNPVELMIPNKLPKIAHPPCRLFGRLRMFSNANPKEKMHAYYSLSLIRTYGGILEHPRSSTLWKTGHFNLSGEVDEFGGFLRSVNLSWFGYAAEKKTMLYFVGLSPAQLPEFPLSFQAIEKSVGRSNKRNFNEIPKKERKITPVGMINYFESVMKIIIENNCQTNSKN